MNAIRFIIREEICLILKEGLQEGDFSQFFKRWGDFVLDSSDYIEQDLTWLYKEGVDSLKFNLEHKDLIYRGMSVNDEWINQFMKSDSIRLGKFWSFDKVVSKDFLQAPDVYDDEFSKFRGKNKLFITAKTPGSLNYIDVDVTVAHGIISSEDELRLLKKTPLEVISINFNSEELSFQGKNLIS